MIEKRLEFDASPERVWQAIADPAEIAQWFGDGAELDLRPGGDGRFIWEKHGSFAVRVVLVEPPRRLSWRWARNPDIAIDEGQSTLVEWVLSERPGGGTVLELRESGFAEDGHVEENTAGWDSELSELADLLGR
jgi:uncharacterized protein YndB with AHSA1/START domain